MNPRNFFAELKRRNVYKVAGTLSGRLAWLLIQVAARSCFRSSEAPDWMPRSVVRSAGDRLSLGG